jgi:hypothetical protein
MALGNRPYPKLTFFVRAPVTYAPLSRYPTLNAGFRFSANAAIPSR